MTLCLIHENVIYLDTLGVKYACPEFENSGFKIDLHQPGITASRLVKNATSATGAFVVIGVGAIPTWFTGKNSDANRSLEAGADALLQKIIAKTEASALSNQGNINFDCIPAEEVAMFEKLLDPETTLVIATQNNVIICDAKARRTSNRFFQVNPSETFALGSRGPITETYINIGYSVKEAIAYAGVFDNMTLTQAEEEIVEIYLSDIIPNSRRKAVAPARRVRRKLSNPSP